MKQHVEEELAWKSQWFSNKRELTFIQKYIPFGLKMQRFKKPELGIEYLLWESSLDDPSMPIHEQSPIQAAAAREKLELYKWWINRPQENVWYLDLMTDALLAEEDAMLIRLMKIRRTLWT